LPKAHFLLAGACHLMGQLDEAIGYCREGKEQFPQAVDLWFHEGVLLLAKNDLAASKECFETILGMPRQGSYVGMDAELAGSRTRHNLGFVYRKLGMHKNAEEQWLAGLKQAPHFEPPWLALLELYIEQNRMDEARSLPKRLEGKTYRDAILPALEARLILAKGEIPGACRILEEALARNPKAQWLRIFLSDILLRVANDPKNAEKHLRTVLAHSPNEQQSRQKLAQLLLHQA
jgi:tetratricopeptide (TPR) repeat protein